MAEITHTERAAEGNTVPAPTTITTPAETKAPAPAPVETKPVTPPEKEGAAWAAIKANERKLQAERDSIRKEREDAKAQIAAERAQHEADLKALEEYRKAKANAKRDPWTYLQQAELDYEKLTEAKR